MIFIDALCLKFYKDAIFSPLFFLLQQAMSAGFGFAVDTVDGAKDGLLCSECGLILKGAVQTSDGLRLCQECFAAIKE